VLYAHFRGLLLGRAAAAAAMCDVSFVVSGRAIGHSHPRHKNGDSFAAAAGAAATGRLKGDEIGACLCNRIDMKPRIK
jgi:hypothetical protein